MTAHVRGYVQVQSNKIKSLHASYQDKKSQLESTLHELVRSENQ